MRDWPAAHSMDSAWYAVDADGNIARFDTGEDGALPVDASADGEARHASFDHERLVAALEAATGTKLDPDDDDANDSIPGIYHYTRDHGDDPGRYARHKVPPVPVGAAALDSASAAAVRKLTLPVRFASDDVVHLADHISESRAVTWGQLPLRYPPGGPAALAPAKDRTLGPWLILGVVFVGLLVVAWAVSRH